MSEYDELKDKLHRQYRESVERYQDAGSGHRGSEAGRE